MLEFIIVSLVGLALSDAGLIPSEVNYSNFPYLKTVHHGDGATSYQNVNVENYGSVPIPKDLQVDDGHEYEHYYHQQPEYRHHHNDETNYQDISSLEHYVDNHVANDHAIVSTETPYELDEHVRHLKLESQDHYSPQSHHDHYDHEIVYEYH